MPCVACYSEFKVANNLLFVYMQDPQKVNTSVKADKKHPYGSFFNSGLYPEKRTLKENTPCCRIKTTTGG